MANEEGSTFNWSDGESHSGGKVKEKVKHDIPFVPVNPAASVLGLGGPALL